MKADKTITNIGFLAITVILLFILAEAGIRIYYMQTGNIIAADEEEKCSKNLHKLISDPNTVNRFHPGFTSYFEYDNNTGVRPKANVRDNKIFRVANGNTMTNVILFMTNTNAQHMRALKDYNIEKNQNMTRLALIGDSFTWGTDVPLKYSYASLLEDTLPDSEVLNFGIEGSGIDIMYLRWKYEVQKFTPDIVILSVYVEDIQRVRPCINKPKITVVNGSLNITNMPPPTHQEILDNYMVPKTGSYLLKSFLYMINNIAGIKKHYAQGLSILKLELEEMQQVSEQDGTFFGVLLIEAGNDHRNSKAELYAIEKTERMLQELSIPYITSSEIFNNENFTPTDYTGERKGHFSPEGNALIAQGLRKMLEENELYDKRDYYYPTWRQSDNALMLISKENEKDIQYIFPYILIQ